MVHKPKHKVHSFRGLLADGGQDEINLERSNVNLAYRVIKFQAISSNPGLEQHESVLKIYREEQTSITGTVDLTDPDVLAVINYTSGNISSEIYFMSVIMDNVLFSRNIYVTHAENDGTSSINYYIEIEEVPVNASTLMQLKLGVARKLNLSESAPDV